MPDHRNQAAIKATAQLITDDNARAVAAGCNSIPADEVIVEPNHAEYIPPSYLRKTGPQLAPAFGELLGLLRDLNAQFVGEPTIEAQATLSLTGEHEWLEEKFLGWCQMYFKIRGSLDRLNPRNGNNPWRLYQDCLEEFHRLLERHIIHPSTINSSVLNLSQRFMLSAFAVEVLEPDLINYGATGRDRYGDPISRRHAIHRVSVWGDAVKEFTKFLQRIAQHLPPKFALNDDDPEWLSGTQTKITKLAEDLSFFRQVHCALNIDNAEKSQLTNDLWARLTWDVYHGSSVAAVLTSSSPDSTIDHATEHQIAFRRDGWLCHREYPWMRVQPDYLSDERRVEFAVNWYVLDTLIAPLYEAWDQLDPGPVIDRGLEPDAAEEEQTAALAVALIERAPPDVDFRATTRRLAPKLWLTKLRNILTNQFDCEWSMAKGSEQKVFRPGGRQFVFGCHGIDRIIHPVQIKNCLKKLGIPLADFIAKLP